jgi:mediator of RNA polymerase II transcription subunit 17, fungi type
MSHAKELLSSLLSPSSTDPQPAGSQETSSLLTSAIVTKPPKAASVLAFDSQLSIGGKDDALRKAADLFRSSAESMERGRVVGAKYWADALKIRRGNWRLIPAPLPFGSSTAKGVDRTSKDFLVSFGLEECSSTTSHDDDCPYNSSFSTSGFQAKSHRQNDQL